MFYYGTFCGDVPWHVLFGTFCGDVLWGRSVTCFITGRSVACFITGRSVAVIFEEKSYLSSVQQSFLPSPIVLDTQYIQHVHAIIEFISL